MSYSSKIWPNAQKICDLAYTWKPTNKLIVPEKPSFEHLNLVKTEYLYHIAHTPYFLKTGLLSKNADACKKASAYANSNYYMLEKYISHNRFDRIKSTKEEAIIASSRFNDITIICSQYMHIFMVLEENYE